ncbi:MAG: hypothetical protein JWP61_536, partial [Friedmanniella sp.]|nr:hypothetical protein [Friedmanniella sp.]
PAVVGGVLSAGAAPLVVLTGDPSWTVLFPFQAGLAGWLVGTGVRLLVTSRRSAGGGLQP